MRRPVLKALTLAVICLPLYGFEFYSKLKNEEGNRHYKKGRLGKAKAAYEKALSASPESDEIAFNLGNTYYREGSFAESLKKFKNAAEETAPPGLQARAFYNIGNALYRQSTLTKAAEFYKQALRIDPKDQDAKYNLELVERALEKKKEEPQKKDKKDQQKKEDQKQDQEEKNKDQNKDKQAKSDQGQGEQKDQKQDEGQSEPKEGDQKKDQDRNKEGGQGPEDQKEGGSGQEQEKEDPREKGREESKGAGGQETGKEKEPEKEEGSGSSGGAQDKERPKSDAEARAEQILAALESGEQQAMKMQGTQNGPGPRLPDGQAKARRITEKDW